MKPCECTAEPLAAVSGSRYLEIDSTHGAARAWKRSCFFFSRSQEKRSQCLLFKSLISKLLHTLQSGLWTWDKVVATWCLLRGRGGGKRVCLHLFFPKYAKRKETISDRLLRTLSIWCWSGAIFSASPAFSPSAGSLISVHLKLLCCGSQ